MISTDLGDLTRSSVMGKETKRRNKMAKKAKKMPAFMMKIMEEKAAKGKGKAGAKKPMKKGKK